MGMAQESSTGVLHTLPQKQIRLFICMHPREVPSHLALNFVMVLHSQLACLSDLHNFTPDQSLSPELISRNESYAHHIIQEQFIRYCIPTARFSYACITSQAHRGYTPHT